MNSLLQIFIPVAFAQTNSDKNNEVVGLFGNILEKLPLWIASFIVVVVFLGIALMVKGWVENNLTSKISEEHQEVMIISGRLSFIAVGLIGVTIALAISGIDLTSLLAALAFGISFGLQDTIANFVAGLALLAARPFTLGDFISVNGKMGKVMEIRTRATYLKTVDGQRLIVPNSELYKSSVLSYTSNATKRVKVPLYCRYGVNYEEVVKICLNLVKKEKKILLEPKPSVVFTDFADYYVELTLRFWIMKETSKVKLRSKLFSAIEAELEKAGLDAPYPVTSLSMEEDAEDAVIKTYALNDKTLQEHFDTRTKERQEFDKYKQLLLQKKEAPVQELPSDQNGMQFLKSDTQVQPTQTAQNTTEQVISQNNPTPEWLKNATQGLSNPPAEQNQTIPLLALTEQSQALQLPAQQNIQNLPAPAAFAPIATEPVNQPPQTQPDTSEQQSPT